MNKLIKIVSSTLFFIFLAVTACVTKVGTSTPYLSAQEEDPLLRDAELVAAEQGISIDEALYRFEMTNEVGPLGAELEKNEAATFAGCWMQHEPEFRFVIAFTENGEETIKKYIKEDSPLDRLIELRTFEVTYEELKAAQQEASQLLEELGLFCDTSINIKENHVEVYVTDNRLFNSTLQKTDAQLPDHVVTIVIYEPLYEVPFELNPDPSVHFPQLKMVSGILMEALKVGELVLEDGYLRVGSSLIIWQPDYFVHNNNGTIEVLDRDGVVVGRVGEEIVMGGGGIPFELVNKLLKEPLPLDTEGPLWLQGGGTRLSLNFSSDFFSLEVITSGEDKVYFLKRKTLLDETARQEITLTGKLQASHDGVIFKCPRIYVEDKPEEYKPSIRYTAFWPADYEARIENGVLEILDESGSVVLRDGEEADITGKVIYGYNKQLHNELPGGYFQPYLIVNRILGDKE